MVKCNNIVVDFLKHVSICGGGFVYKFNLKEQHPIALNENKHQHVLTKLEHCFPSLLGVQVTGKIRAAIY